MANLQRDLVRRAADGDQEAFESLVRLSAGRLFAIAYRVLRDHDYAEDAVQQTLTTIWNELPRLRDPDRFEAWGYRLIVRASVAQARHERGFGGRALSTIEVADESGTLVDARTGQPAEDPSDSSPDVRNDPADPATVVLTWYGLLSDTDRRLTIAPDGRTMTLDKLPGCGDLVPVNRVLALTFSSPVPADEVTLTIVDEPRTCE